MGIDFVGYKLLNNHKDGKRLDRLTKQYSSLKIAAFDAKMQVMAQQEGIRNSINILKFKILDMIGDIDTKVSQFKIWSLHPN